LKRDSQQHDKHLRVEWYINGSNIMLLPSAFHNYAIV
jgi:hypothetical protein